jgi:hypothetical protein
MYHPYLNQVAKHEVKERRQHADMARQAEQARGERVSLLSRLYARLSSLLSHRNHQTGIRQRTAQAIPPSFPPLEG